MSTHGKLFPYCQTESLLLQFILQEWITSYQLLEPLKAENNTFAIEELLNQLFTSFSRHRSCFDLKEGSLIVLHNYITLFLQQFEQHKIMMTRVATATHKSIQEIVFLQELLFKMKHFPKKMEETSYKASMTKVQGYLLRAAYYLSKILHQYMQDENLGLFIYNHLQDLTPFFKEGVDAFLQKYFPMGLEEMRLYLTSRFEKRGFVHLMFKVNT